MSGIKTTETDFSEHPNDEMLDSVLDFDCITETPIKPGRRAPFVPGRKLRNFKGKRNTAGDTKSLLTCKVILIGPSGSGKTTFIKQWLKIEDGTKATVGVDSFRTKVTYRDTKLAVHYWDIMGQDYYYKAGMNRPFFRDANVAILFFDRTNRMSFLRALEWKKHLDTMYLLPDGSPLPCVLVANKIDLHIAPAVSKEEIFTTVQEMRFVRWFPISAIRNYNVPETIGFVIDDFLARCTLHLEMPRVYDSESLYLEMPKVHDSKPVSDLCLSPSAVSSPTTALSSTIASSNTIVLHNDETSGDKGKLFDCCTIL